MLFKVINIVLVLFGLVSLVQCGDNATMQTSPLPQSTTVSPHVLVVTPLTPNITLQRWNNLTAVLNRTFALIESQIQNRTQLWNDLVNSTRDSFRAGSHVATESVVRPLAFFVGQNLRLLGNGLWSFGHILKHSGYRISNWEPLLQNTSIALRQYGQSLVKTYASPNQTIPNLDTITNVTSIN